MEQSNNSTINRGFTILEVIVAIFILTVGILGSYTLITQTVSNSTYASDKLVASYLAQEGIEIVRNIRDTNWLEQLEDPTNLWDEGLTSCSGGLCDNVGGIGCIVSYTDTAIKDVNLNTIYNKQFLNIDTNHFYSYSAGTQTKFKRKVVINPNGSDILNVCVYVEWEEKGKPYSIVAREDLYNWR